MAVPGTDLGALGGLANPGFGALQPIPSQYKSGYAPPPVPAGIKAPDPGSVSASVMGDMYNPNTGERYTTTSGGYSAEPGSGWVSQGQPGYVAGTPGQATPDMRNKFGQPSALPKGLKQSNSTLTVMANYYNDQTGQRYTGGPGMAEPGSGWREVKSDSYDGQGKRVSQDPINMPGFVGPTYSAPTIPSLPSLVGTAPSGIPPVPTEVPATQTPSPGALPSTPIPPSTPAAPNYGALPSTPVPPATPYAPNYGALPSTPIPPATPVAPSPGTLPPTPYAPNYGALPSPPYAPNYGALPSTSATPSVGSPTTGSGTKMGILEFLTEGAPIPAGSAPVAKTTTNTTPDWYTNYAKDLLSGQQQVSTTPYQTYQGPRIADFTATQRQGMGQTTDAAGLGAAPIRQGIGVAQQQIGQSGLSAAQPYLQQAGQASYGNIASYMNPYNEAVTSRIAELGARNLREQILPGINDQFISAGQAGSSRNAEMFSRAARDTNESIIAAQNAALQSGYSGALTASQADLARQGQLANIAGGLGTEGVRSGLDTAKTLADLGTSAQTSGLAGAAAVTGVGAAQQGLNQQNLTLAYQDFLRQQGYPQEQIDAALKTMAGIGATKAIPTAQTEVGIEPTAYPQQYAPSALSTGLGTIATGAGIAKDLSEVDWAKLANMFR